MNTIISTTDRSDTSRRGDSMASTDLLMSALKSWRQNLGYYSMFAALPALVASQFSEAKAEDVDRTHWPVASSARLGDKPRRRSARPALLGNGQPLPYQRGGSDIISPLAGSDNCPGTPIPGGTYTAASPYIDVGDTTAANNTVNRAYWIHYGYYWWDTPGPDHIYTFTLNARGTNARIQVSRTSGTYEPLIYILDGRFGCPAGTDQNAFNQIVAEQAPSGTGTATLDSLLAYVPLNIPLHLFIDSAHTDARGSGPYTVRLQNLTVAPTVGVQRTKFDFDGDSRSDLSVFRPSDSVWYIDRSTQGYFETRFGLAADTPAPADYDGDGKTDIGIFRDGTWWWINSSDQTVTAIRYGTSADKAIPADFSSDGRAELVIFRNGEWYIRDLATGEESVTIFGLPGDRPVVADYDADGRADRAIYRNGQWHVNRSSAGYFTIPWGTATDTPVVGDYEGDGRADLAVYRNGEWWVMTSFSGYSFGYRWTTWGTPTDVPVPADYDGDAFTDIAVFRNGLWYIQRSTGGTSVHNFGLAGDKAIPASYVP